MLSDTSRALIAALQVSKDLPLNPIVQDQKKGKARFVHNCFPHHGYIWNYGCFPQVSHVQYQLSHCLRWHAQSLHHFRVLNSCGI